MFLEEGVGVYDTLFMGSERIVLVSLEAPVLGFRVRRALGLSGPRSWHGKNRSEASGREREFSEWAQWDVARATLLSVLLGCNCSRLTLHDGRCKLIL